MANSYMWPCWHRYSSEDGSLAGYCCCRYSFFIRPCCSINDAHSQLASVGSEAALLIWEICWIWLLFKRYSLVYHWAGDCHLMVAAHLGCPFDLCTCPHPDLVLLLSKSYFLSPPSLPPSLPPFLLLSLHPFFHSLYICRVWLDNQK